MVKGELLDFSLKTKSQMRNERIAILRNWVTKCSPTFFNLLSLYMRDFLTRKELYGRVVPDTFGKMHQ